MHELQMTQVALDSTRPRYDPASEHRRTLLDARRAERRSRLRRLVRR